MLARVGTSTLTGVLNRRGLKSMTLFDVWPMRPEQPAMVGIAFTMRFIPSREDKDGPTSTNRSMVQPQAMEECPPGHVLMIDSRGDSRAASAGDLYIGRLKARGAAGVVTDGGFRDTNGVFKTGLPAYHRRPSSPPSPIVHRPVDLQLPIGCGGVAVYPGDIVVGDRDAVLVIPPDIVEAVAEEALKNYEYESWAELEVAKGRSLKGLFPVAGDQAKAGDKADTRRGRRRTASSSYVGGAPLQWRVAHPIQSAAKTRHWSGAPAAEDMRCACGRRAVREAGCVVCGGRSARPMLASSRLTTTKEPRQPRGGNDHDAIPRGTRLCCLSARPGLGARRRRRRTMPIRRGPSRSSCRSRPAAAPTSMRAPSPNG